MSGKKDTALLRVRLQSVKNKSFRSNRGQFDPQYILGAFVIIIIAGPLAGAAVNIQTSLASTPAFSWFTGSVIALLFVAAVVAAALGLE